MSNKEAERAAARFIVMAMTLDSEGWKEIAKEFEEELASVRDSILVAGDEVEVFRLQGRAQQLNVFLSLPQIVEHALAQATESVEEAA